MTTSALGLLQQGLVRLCQTRGISRFSAQEMIELLEDGEEPAWIVEQVLPGGRADPAHELRTVLEEIAAQVGPSPEPAAADEVGSTQTLAELSEAVDPAAALQTMELPPGVDRAQFEQLLSSPRGALLADFGRYCEENGFSQEKAISSEKALLPENVQSTRGGVIDEELRELHDEWMQTPRDSLAGKKPSQVMSGGLFPEKVETFRRESPKVGRNDPCPCGSGKKFKKCCG